MPTISSKVSAVKCMSCGRLHEDSTDTFVAVHGNITKGLGGGIVGNNLDQNERVKHVSIFCFPHCFAQIMGISTEYKRQFT